MTALALAEKTCAKCGIGKPLSEFYRQKATHDGHTSRCRDCTKKAVKASIARRRADLGEEAWLASRVKISQKHRTSGAYSRLPMIAYSNATHELRRRHPDEFRALLRIERYELGLDPDSKSAS